jgi:hypothetical protein
LALDIESKALMGPRHSVWGKFKVNLPADYDFDYSLLTIKPMTPPKAEAAFLNRFNTLWLQR